MSGSWNTKSELPSSMNSTKHRSKGRGGGNRTPRNLRTGSSPPPQHANALLNIEDGNSINIYENKYFVYHITSNLGETARIEVRNGDIYEGILRAVSPKFDCTLNEAHLLHKRQANGHVKDELVIPCKEHLISQLVIALKDMVSVNITKTHDPELRTSNDNFTDEAITGSVRQANGQRIERPLQKWVPQESDLSLQGGLEEDVKVNGWNPVDMFKTNAEKFGVTSTYNDNLLQYTTPLPKDSTREMELRAEQTAREIEQSKGFSLREEVDMGRTEEEAFASVVRPPTAVPTVSKAVQPQQQQSPSTENSTSVGKPQRGTQAKPASAPLSAERSSLILNADSPSTSVGQSTIVASPVTVPTTCVTMASKTTVTAEVISDASTSSAPNTTASTTTLQTHEIVKDLKDFQKNFQLAEKPPRKSKEPENESGKKSGTASAQPEKSVAEELPSSETPTGDTKEDSKKTNSSSYDSILVTSKLNPLAKEFKLTPKPQKTTPPPQPTQYVPVVAGPPFSPTSVRPGHPSGAFPQPVVMVQPQPMNIYRQTKQPFNKPRGHSYSGREQGEPSSFMSAAVAAGSPIFTPGGTFPQQMYPMPGPPQPVYVQSSPGMVTPPIPVGQYVIPTGPHPRFIAPVSNTAGSPSVSMSQAYQEASPVPLYVAGNMGGVQGTPTPQGQPPPQPSPSHPGQFIFTAVPPMGGPPQPSGPHQGPYAQSQMIYIPQAPPQVGPSSSVPVSAATAPVPYMTVTGSYHGERLQ